MKSAPDIRKSLTTRKIVYWVFLAILIIAFAYLFLGGWLVAKLFIDPEHTFTFIGFGTTIIIMILAGARIETKIDQSNLSTVKKNLVQGIFFLAYLLLIFILYELGEKAGVVAHGPGPLD